MWTRHSLQQALDEGGSFRFRAFYGHTVVPGRVTEACFSQWFPSPFVVEGVRYLTAEHWMMAGKARLFDDATSLQAILECGTPAEAKRLGRQVRGFVESTWAAQRSGLVLRGNVEKFSQHTDLWAVLDATGEDVLVEAAPQDTIWGIGLGRAHANVGVPGRWKGLNLLGFALMEARRVLRAQMPSAPR